MSRGFARSSYSPTVECRDLTSAFYTHRLAHGFGEFADLLDKEDKLFDEAVFGPATFLTDLSEVALKIVQGGVVFQMGQSLSS